MKRNRILLVAAAAGLTLGLGIVPAHALTISGVHQNDTSDNDNHGDEDAGTSSAWIGSSSVTVGDVVGHTATVERRFTGHVEAINDGNITQSIDVRVTWTVTASANTFYSITFSPEFHGALELYDDLADESGDTVGFSTLSASLLQDGGAISASGLGLSGGTRGTDGTSNVDDTGSKTITGLFGTHTFELRYTGTATANAASATLCQNQSALSALWGMDGTLAGGCNYPDGFDAYASTGARDNDGLFVPATVTVTAVVPEPGTMLLLASGLVGLSVCGRRRA